MNFTRKRSKSSVQRRIFYNPTTLGNVKKSVKNFQDPPNTQFMYLVYEYQYKIHYIEFLQFKSTFRKMIFLKNFLDFEANNKTSLSSALCKSKLTIKVGT